MLAQFALRLIGGMGLMWVLLPRRQMSAGFFRIQMLVTLGLAVLAALTAERFPHDPSPPNLLSSAAVSVRCAALALLSFAGSVLWTLQRRGGGTACAFAICGVALLTLCGHAVTEQGLRTEAGWATLASAVSSAALLGSAVTGMLLGHWYLTAPTMSLVPLVRATACFGAAAVLRLVVAGLSLWLAGDEFLSQAPAAWLALRWLAGILGPLVTAAMVWRILRYRNTQSATGVLFVGVILVFLGEAAALLIHREFSVPL